MRIVLDAREMNRKREASPIWKRQKWNSNMRRKRESIFRKYTAFLEEQSRKIRGCRYFSIVYPPCMAHAFLFCIYCNK